MSDNLQVYVITWHGVVVAIFTDQRQALLHARGLARTEMGDYREQGSPEHFMNFYNEIGENAPITLSGHLVNAPDRLDEAYHDAAISYEIAQRIVSGY